MFVKNCPKYCLTGSLAYLFYTKDFNSNVNDIDLMCEYDDILKMSKILSGKYYFDLTTYNSMNIFNNDMKISLDSISHYFTGLERKFEIVKINNILFKIITIDSLIEVYRRGFTTIEIKKEQYLEKYKKLIMVKNLITAST